MFFLSDQPSSTELVFLTCAIGGTLFFILRVLLVLVGGFGAEDFDTGADADVEFDADAHDGSQTELAFKLVSLNSIAAFVMMFGWSGMTAYVEYQAGPLLSLVIAVIVGFMMMVLTAYLFAWFTKLQSAGADFSLAQVVGLKAKVYQRIPAQGNGKVQVTVDGMLRELDAQSSSGEEIESFTIVTIKSLNGTSGVVVEPAAVEQ